MKVLPTAFLALALAGCVNFSTYHRLHAGSTRTDVRRAMHACPNSIANAGDYQAYVYTALRTNFFQWSEADYVFVFKGEALTEFGPGVVQERPGPTGSILVRVPPKKSGKDAAKIAEVEPAKLEPGCG
jgi:hypothetical protein